MANGTEKPIEQVEPGDRVLSYDVDTRELQPATVSMRHHHRNHRVYALVVDGRQDVITTEEHKFYVNGVWKTIANLGHGTPYFLAYDKERARVGHRKWRETVSLETRRDVYNLTLTDGPPVFIAGGLIAHNTKDRFGGEMTFGESDFFS